MKLLSDIYYFSEESLQIALTVTFHYTGPAPHGAGLLLFISRHLAKSFSLTGELLCLLFSKSLPSSKTNLVHSRGRSTFWRFYFRHGTGWLGAFRGRYLQPDGQDIVRSIRALSGNSVCCLMEGIYLFDMLETSLRMFNPHNGHKAGVKSGSSRYRGMPDGFYSIWSFKQKVLCWWSILPVA